MENNHIKEITQLKVCPCLYQTFTLKFNGKILTGELGNKELFGHRTIVR